MIFLDTSVWIACVSDRHPHHAASHPLPATIRRHSTACAAHSLAEAYSSLTRLPAESRARPRDAMDYLRSIEQRATVVSLDGTEYLGTIDELSARGLTGGIVHDALLLACARKVNAERIYTWNLRHSRTVAPDLIVTP